jgi:hypothetical protein
MNGVVDSFDPSAAAAAPELMQAEDDGRRLTLGLGKGRIVSAAHDGVTDPAERRVFDAFCRVLKGLPIQEAADHAGHHVMARLRGPGEPRPVPGIVTPWNADPLYRRPMRLIRRIRADHAARRPAASGENFWNPAISKDWLCLDQAAQRARVEEILGGFLADQGLAAGAMVAVGVETNIRVFIAFSEDVGYGRKPALLMDFERKLRAATGDRLEVFAEEMADENKLRRL